MTAADILAVTIGCLIGGAITAVMYETGWRWHRRRHARAPEPERVVRDPELDPSSAEAKASAYRPMQDSVNRLLANRPDYPDDWVPLSRMTREEIEAHMWRLETPAPSVGIASRPCLCGRPHSDPVHVRTVDLTAPEAKEHHD